MELQGRRGAGPSWDWEAQEVQGWWYRSKRHGERQKAEDSLEESGGSVRAVRSRCRDAVLALL